MVKPTTTTRAKTTRKAKITTTTRAIPRSLVFPEICSKAVSIIASPLAFPKPEASRHVKNPDEKGKRERKIREIKNVMSLDAE